MVSHPSILSTGTNANANENEKYEQFDMECFVGSRAIGRDGENFMYCNQALTMGKGKRVISMVKHCDAAITPGTAQRPSKFE